MNEHTERLGKGSEPFPMGQLEHRVREYRLDIPLPYAPRPRLIADLVEGGW